MIWSNFCFRIQHSFFTSGPKFIVNIVVRLWAHILRSAVALMSAYMLLSQPYFTYRYIDNCVPIIPANFLHTLQVWLFWKLDFSTASTLLETVAGKQSLGFTTDPDQRTITFCQPWNQLLRSCRGSGTFRGINSGITARLPLILQNGWPHSVRDAQIQDFLGLMSRPFPFLQKPSFRDQLVILCRSFHCHMSHQGIFRFAR